MFVCPFKKVTIQKNSVITCISSNNITNTIAIGGENGFLKIVKIDLKKSKTNAEGNPVSPLTFNQTLTSHKGKITHLVWNEVYDKLTSCDEEGVIVVWRINEHDLWETEMINNREVSYITDIKWSGMGNFLCFIYDDGHAIIGSVDGNRCWGNDILPKLYKVEWSPDESFILFCIKNSNAIVFSYSGYQIGDMYIPPHLMNYLIVDILWWSNSMIEKKSIVEDHHLLLAFENGTFLLYNSHQDLSPIEIKTHFNIINKVLWSVNGETIMLSGCVKEDKALKDAICFYSNSGSFLQEMKVPNKITSMAWDSHGTKMALTTESFILFCLVKPNYKWTYFNETLVYTYMTDNEHHTIVFWDISKKGISKRTNKNYKYVKNLIGIASFGSFCIFTAKKTENTYIVILCNSIGSPVDNRILNIVPKYVTMNNTHAIIASDDHVYIWQFRYERVDMSLFYGNKLNSDILNKSMNKEIAFNILDKPDLKDEYNLDTFDIKKKTNDPISAICCNENKLVIALNSGKGYLYNLPDLNSVEKIFTGNKLHKIGISPDCKHLWGIDDQHYLGIWNIDKVNKTYSDMKGEKLPEFEKNDVWTVIWSKDDSNSFAFTQKNMLYIYKNFESEEVLTNNGYLAEFSDLSIKTIFLEEAITKPGNEESIKLDDIYFVFETRVLRDLRQMMESNVILDDIYNYCVKHNHPKLWDLFIKHCMLKLEFIIAEKCLIQQQDFIGLNLLKRIKNMDDDDFKRAEIYQHFFDYDKAEEIYKNKERKDILIKMRIKLGNWGKVIDLIQESQVVQEDELKIALNNQAMQYLENLEYHKAEELFSKTGNKEELINVWFLTENFQKAAEYIEKIPEENDFLLYMGEKFEVYGLTTEAVKCYLRFGDVKKAIDICVLTNQWNLAVEIAEQNNLFQIESLVNKFSNMLIEKNKKMDLVEFYRKAHKHTEAAKILIRIGEELRALNTSSIILKKIYVLAALEMESFKTRYIDAQITNNIATVNNFGGNTTNKNTLDTLITSDLSNLGDKALNNPWKGAEAYHYYMLCQKQIYNKEYSSALKTALRLVQYEYEVESKEVYRLITISSLLNKSYKECSKALAKLKNLSDLTEDEKTAYDELSFSVFTNFQPQNEKENYFNCPGKNCDAKISE